MLHFRGFSKVFNMVCDSKQSISVSLVISVC